MGGFQVSPHPINFPLANISLSIAGSFSDDVYLEFHRDKFSFSWQRITLPKKENRMALNQLSEQKEE